MILFDNDLPVISLISQIFKLKYLVLRVLILNKN